jgi:hypothetical protein
VRRGCISLGTVICNGCQRTILYPERYLTYDEESKPVTLCISCCVEKGLAHPESDKANCEMLFNLSSE